MFATKLFLGNRVHANKAFSTFTTELSVFTDPAVVMIFLCHQELFPNADLAVAIPIRSASLYDVFEDLYDIQTNGLYAITHTGYRYLRLK
ncbi:hypothetical protein DV515_00000119 [Chloebia gouldiae]|uniref:Uncharacterized protein n=1 Tax=Chloebia gouldiae TaxID=44316 RepID=A0A3L8T0D1_CHLGU|nr:hypothetical protein DV515_00000119 [Chloebia gouldiae]